MDRLRNFVGDRTLLLVLDNCEHLVEAVACLCEAFLQACPQAQILATSREALGVSYESVWPVPPLAVPPVPPDKALLASTPMAQCSYLPTAPGQSRRASS